MYEKLQQYDFPTSTHEIAFCVELYFVYSFCPKFDGFCFLGYPVSSHSFGFHGEMNKQTIKVPSKLLRIRFLRVGKSAAKLSRFDFHLHLASQPELECFF